MPPMKITHLDSEPAAHEVCNRTLIISGCTRSGTTIVGQVLHSMDEVELCYEPPALCSLIALVGELPKEVWRLLYATYLYEEFLINAVSGRSLNCNRTDDSSIYRVKDAAWVESRLSRSVPKRVAARVASGRQLALKIPDVVPFLPKVCEYYPGLRVVLVHRNANDTFNSLMAKRWFSDEAVREGSLIYPRRTVRGIHVPYWVAPEDAAQWAESDELRRVTYYYVRITRVFESITNRIVVDYDQMVNNPDEVVAQLASRLSLTYGARTRDVIQSIRRRERPREDYVSQLEPAMRQEVLELSKRYSSGALCH